ncbi:polysaccharide pyruvyl transferase family protein [bacterium]|nr:polysaccharide pyruvyl transferase family protein [bacterium]
MKNMPFDVPGLWEGYEKYFRERSVTSPRVVIHGGYGKRNTGDDAILNVLIDRTREHFPKARITVLCHGPQNVLAWYPDVQAYHFKSLGALKTILTSDIYFIGGGGIVNKINTYSGNQKMRLLDMKGKFLFMAAWLAKRTGAQTHFYAIGATSFPDAAVKRLARWSLASADVVSVRDPRSLRNLREAGVKREIIPVRDPALSLEPAPREEAVRLLKKLGLEGKPERKRPLLGLNLRYVGDPEVDNESTLREGARVTKWLIGKGWDVLFLPISQHPSKHLEDDLDLGRQLRSRVGDSSLRLLEEYPHPRVMMALLGELDILATTRLHAVILGSKMDIPIFTISYDHKVTEFVKLLGWENMLLPLKDFSLETLQSRLEPYLDRIHPGPPPLSS